jgi:hypothetical protein
VFETTIENSDILAAMQMSSSGKRKSPGRDDAGVSSVLTVLTRNKLQRSDCNDVGSSYTKLMLQNTIMAAATKPACTTDTYTSTGPTTSNNDAQKYRSPTTSTPTFTPNYRNNQNHNPTTTSSSSSSKQNHVTTTRTPVVAATTDVARLVQELLELCGSHNYSHSNRTDNNNDNWKQTREKLWRMGDAAFKCDRSRDAIGDMGGCLVVTHCLKAVVKAATDMHTTTTTAADPSLLSTLLTVQEAACFCLTNLTYRHQANRNRLMAAGGASVLVAVLRGAAATGSMHGTAAAACSRDGSGVSTSSTSKVCSQAGTVLSRACMVLDNLAASESCQEAIVQADVMEAVCATMLAFPGARELQFSGCRILGRLAESCKNNNGKQQQQQQVQLRAVRANGVVAVAQAFQRFCQTDAATARMASAALQCLTATTWHDTTN